MSVTKSLAKPLPKPLPRPTTVFEPIEELMIDAVAAKVVEESVRLKLFDILETPKTTAEISAILGSNARVVEAILYVLEIKGLIMKTGQAYVNMPMASEFLVSTSPFWQGSFLLSQQERHTMLIDTMADLMRGQARAGQGTPGQHWVSVDALNTLGQYSLQGSLQDMVAFITALPLFSRMRRMCDVGGNHGRYTMALLDQNPEMTAEILDVPSVVPAIQTLCEESGHGARLSAREFDLRRDSLPEATYDLILISHVLHLFSRSLPKTLKVLASGVAPGGWLVSQNLDRGGDGSPTVLGIRELMTRMMGVQTHLLTAEHMDLMRATLRDEGFDAFTTGRGGHNGNNLIFAARKTA